MNRIIGEVIPEFKAHTWSSFPKGQKVRGIIIARIQNAIRGEPRRRMLTPAIVRRTGMPGWLVSVAKIMLILEEEREEIPF